MLITLDHNCLIDVKNKSAEGLAVLKIISNPEHICFIVNIGASELRERGIRPDTYNLFENLLHNLGLNKLGRLNPIDFIDITFIDYCIISSKEMNEQYNRIESILFPNPIKKDSLIFSPPYKPIGKKCLNRICDISSMWCHIHYKNQIFLTSDWDFLKMSKKKELIKLGAGKIVKPSEFII